MEKHARHDSSPRSGKATTPSFEELAAQQGVTAVLDFEAFFGTPSPDDESVEEFAVTLREWRREGLRQHDSR